ncbi:double-strand break repair helicase AddA [Neorhizobium galegae]|uniref:double-strand break repair helicase AddA n=1 Tax=Neorhizobium galegae TaxID=399 RepID=UPI00062228FB|nr:double-strand break repair helicase AddA [Neorhizobium galegae]MCQ1852124.1 double-strand break repair helicase AddA [Neorhizobium galegae]CDZ52013.1 Double-strand break repair helicase AddA [Neorhizobium galegae bv. orientalis]
MSDLAPEGDDPIKWIDWTTVQQSLASDPISSAWVSANAGSGKTHVLTQRVIRLLLAGCRPSSILCLTYTKAAASEMSNRVFQRLSEWTVLSDDELRKRIASIEGAEPDFLKLAEARRLFAKALETPGGLKIQTIHAFCEALLHQFPLEANVAGHFSVLDDRAASALLADARRSLLTATSAEEDPVLAEAFAHVLDLGDEFGLETLLGDIIANRTAIRRFIAHAERHGGIGVELKRALGLGPADTEDSIAAGYWPLPGLSGLTLDLYLALADQKGGQKVTDVAYGLRLVAKEPDVLKRAQHLDQIFLTREGKPKADSSLVAKAMTTTAPELTDAVAAARAHVVACRDRLRLIRMFLATKAALTLAQRLNDDYEDLKKQRSLLDFEDLIARTADLLTRDGVGAWVHYKLDQGIDHILVDEAQDTSPIQWTVIKSLAEDFYSGASARETRRTIFAVGDEKQSIYSFQGARPERFAEERSETEKRVRASDQAFHSVRLPLSFRSTADVLAAVDQVFSLEENFRGLSALGEPVQHRSNRIGHPGAVDLWDVVVPEVAEQEEDWTAPFDSTPDKAPSAILAGRIANRIEEMIGKETIIEKGVERPIEAGDILVLVRKRDAFVNALTRALKRRDNIPVAGADRLRLTSHIAVQDLLALGRFLLLPQDDLSLAALLKSPLFNLSEEDVFEVAARRAENTSAWTQLNRLSDEQPLRFRDAAERLQHLLSLSRQLSPHDLFARILGAQGGRRKFLGRLGTEAGDILDEFLTFALDHETNGLPGLQAFISTLEIESPEVKREQDGGRNEVRIMTVHASKGLEAPVVFLVDSGSKAFISSHVPKFRLLRIGGDSVPAWVPGKMLTNAMTSADDDRIRTSTEEEYRRLLYVGMTRAADRLIVCGYRGKIDNPDTWQSMISKALAADEHHCSAAEFQGSDDQWGGFRWRLPAAPGQAPKIAHKEAAAADKRPLPASLSRPLPAQKILPRPLSPSGAGTMIDDDADDLIVTSPLFADQKDRAGLALQKGKLVHRMLQMLTDFPEPERASAARRYADRAARFWPAAEREKLVASVMSVLSHAELGPVFSERSQSEVSIMGTLTLEGRDYAISGRIDRLVVTEDRVIILDYKTNRVPPKTLEDVPLSHRAQLAIYCEILRPLYPAKSFECVLVYTESAQVVTLPAELLSRSLAELKTK